MPNESRSLLNRRRSYVLLTLACVLAGSANAQFVQQGTKLVGTGAVGNANQGGSVALSADGNMAIVGGPFDNAVAGCPGNMFGPCYSYAGAAWVYTRSGGTWTQQGGKLAGTGAAAGQASQGWSVALSADGYTAILGGPWDGPIIFDPHTPAIGSSGAAWVYTRTGSVWTQQGSKLVGSGVVTGDYGIGAQQGWSVALSADGNAAIVGGPIDNNRAGAAWVYTRAGGVWTQQGSKLVATDAVGSAGQGTSVALSADGNIAIVGGPGDNGGAGAAWVYMRSGGVWSRQGGKLAGTGAVGNAGQGYSVALSADGNTAVVGGRGDNGGAGAAWVYTRSGGAWTQQGSKLAGAGAVGNATQGNSVALSSDGTVAVVGGPGDNGGAGATWVYTRLGGLWTQQGSKLAGAGAAGSAVQGTSLALSPDASTLLVGGGGDNGGVGAAWVFVGPGAIGISGVANGFSFQQGFAPGMILSIFGTNLANSTQTESTAPLPFSVAGVSATINGIPAPFYYLSPGQLNLQIPYETPVGTATLALNNNGRVATATFNVSASAPGISVTSSGMLNPNTGASRGQSLGLFITGAGTVNPAVSNGATPPANVTPQPVLPVSMTIGGITCPLLYVGLPSWSVGVTQINFTVPQNVPAGTQNVVVTIGGVASPPAKITIQ